MKVVGESSSLRETRKMLEMDNVLDEALDELDDDSHGGASNSDGNRLGSRERKNSPSDVNVIDEHATESAEGEKKVKRTGGTEHSLKVEENRQYGPQTVEEALG